jgi:hypothetical protein
MKNRHIPACNTVALRARTFTTTLLALGFLALSTIAQAAPETALPGGNTADGHLALASITTGLYNSAFGIYSLLSLTDGNFCTGVGAGTLLSNTADENTATGAGALLSNVTGTDTTADGAFALLSNTATGNTAIGARSLLSNTTGGTLANIQGIDVGPNVAVGWQALESNTIASANTAVGYQALQSFTTGPMGFEQLGLCTAVGFQALTNATTGFANSAFGYQALFSNTEGGANVAIGHLALSANTTGDSNVATGGLALAGNETGDNNTADGFGALDANTTGSDNTAIGNNALGSSTGDGNTALGVQSGVNVSTANNVICIGAFGQNVDDSCYIGNIFGQTSVNGVQVFINSDNKLGTVTSSKRFKEEIKPMDIASEALFELKPVSFRYKKEIDPAGTSQFGLVAEDVENVNPDLVIRDKDGKPYTVRYDQVNAMLLNEFLKEHTRMEELESDFQATAAQQQKQIRALTAQLKEQAAQIQKVSAWIEMSRSPRKVALSSQ